MTFKELNVKYLEKYCINKKMYYNDNYSIISSHNIHIYPLKKDNEYFNKVQVFSMIESGNDIGSVVLILSEEEFLKKSPDELYKDLVCQKTKNDIEKNRLEKIDTITISKFISELKSYDYGVNVSFNFKIKSGECYGMVKINDKWHNMYIKIKRQLTDEFTLDIGYGKDSISGCFEDALAKTIEKIKKDC